MKSLLVAAVVATMATLCFTAGVAQSSVHFVSLPDYLRVNVDAGPLDMHSVGDAILAALGVQTQLSWTGLSSASAFARPRIVLSLAIDTAGLDIAPAQPVASATLEQEGATSSALLGSLHYKVAETAQQVYGENLQLAAAAMAVQGADALSSQVNSGVLGAGVTADSENTLALASGARLSLREPTVAALVEQLVAIASSLREQPSEDARVFLQTAKVDALPAVVARFGKSSDIALACAELVGAVVEMLSAKATEMTQGNALVMVSTVHAAPVSPIRMRRAGGLGANPATTDIDFVEHCETYNCFCHSDKNNKIYDPATRCSVDCNDKDPCVDCSYIPCDCSAADRVMPGQSKCSACSTGYALHDNHCYLDSDFPVATAIILLLGIALVVGLLFTCVSIANMDPGRDSIIYRMTSTHLKSS